MKIKLIAEKSKYVIRDYMKKAHLTYWELATILNVTTSYIYAVINDKKTVNVETANRILNKITEIYYLRNKI